MSKPKTYAQARLEELPTVLDGPIGQGLARAFGEAQDAEQLLLTQGMLMRYPPRTAADALGFLGHDSNIDRFDGETDAAYQARLVARWNTWKKAGSAQGIIDSIVAFCAALGTPATDVQVYQDFEGAGAYMPGDWYSRFWVVIGPTMPFAPMLLGSWVLGTGTLGSSARHTHVAAIKRQVLKWKASHSYPVAIVLRFDATDPPVGMDTTIGASIMGGGLTFVRWDLGRIFGLDTFMPFTLGGYNL